jgi:hypothetical protein
MGRVLADSWQEKRVLHATEALHEMWRLFFEKRECDFSI